MFQKLCALVVVIAVAHAAHLEASSVDCTATLTPTVTFSTSCTTIEASCWSPHAPTATDVAVFPAGVSASAPFSYLYTPVVAASIVIEAGASITLMGSAFQFNDCLQVKGSLTLSGGSDTGATSTVAFPADSSVPHGTDCPTVPQGFTPRLCGPGQAVITGTLTAKGLFASNFAATTVASGAQYNNNNGSFLWGNVTNQGTMTGDGKLYFHGELNNAVNGVANFHDVRADRWSENIYALKPILIIRNDGELSFNFGKYYVYDFVSTFDNMGSLVVTLKLLNNGGTVTFYNPASEYGDVSFGGIGLDIANMGGTIKWTGLGLFWGTGSFLNVNGTYLVNTTDVHVSDYISQGGHIQTLNYGQFTFGSSSGVDKKFVSICEKKPPRQTPHVVGVKPREIIRFTNQSCNPQVWNSCPLPLCCGSSGFCETANCQNADGYGGGPMCCLDNAFCSGSSHGAYCGGGIFSWEVDSDCVEGTEFVDRYEFEFMKKHFHVELPKFGKYRYTFRGDSRISGDGTGEVVFTEPIEIRDTLRVEHGGVLTNLMDNGFAPTVGNGALHIGGYGTMRSGIRTMYDRTSRIVVEAHGRFEVPRYGTMHLQSEAPMAWSKKSQLHVDGRVLMVETGKNVVVNCAAVSGGGAFIGDTDLSKSCPTA